MSVINTIWDYVLSLFSRKSVDKHMQASSAQHKAEYEAVEKINFTSIFASSLAHSTLLLLCRTASNATSIPEFLISPILS